MHDQTWAGRLGEYLTGAEARDIADHLAGDETLSQALKVVSQARRVRIREILEQTEVEPDTQAGALAALRAIQGAHVHASTIMPVWTTPGNLAENGQLTASIHHLVTAARGSVICSTFNFQRSSALWTALKEVAARPELAVRLYVDTDVADAHPEPWKPTTAQIAAELAGAIVLRTRIGNDGERPRNHAKFIAIDHQYLLVTSANFSKSAEQLNVELGIRIDDPLLTQSIEAQMRALEPHLYERVPA